MGRGWNSSLWSNVIFEKEVIFHEFDFETSDLEFEVTKSSICPVNEHNFGWQGCFFFHFYLATSSTNWAQIFTGFLFYANVEINQVRRLVFDTYQKCPLSLKQISVAVLNNLLTRYSTNVQPSADNVYVRRTTIEKCQVAGVAVHSEL